MEKAIATDLRLLERAREQMVKTAQECGLTLRQNDNREAPKLALQAGRYAHGRQFKRIESSIAHTAHPGWPCQLGCPALDRQSTRASASPAQRVARQGVAHPDAKDQGQAVCIGCAGGRMHCQRQG